MFSNEPNKIKTSDFSIELKNNNHYHITINEQVFFTILHLKQIVDAQRELGSRKLPVLVIASEGVDTDVDLLKELAREDNQPYSSAVAFVLTSLPQKILSKLYVKIIKPKIPTQFFNDTQEAFHWLSDNHIITNKS